MNYSEILSYIKDISIAIAALAGAVVAWRGLNTWKKELRGKKEFELAFRILRAANSLRTEINSTRNVTSDPAKYPERIAILNKKQLNLRTLSEAGEALLGPQIREASSALIGHTNWLIHNILLST